MRASHILLEHRMTWPPKMAKHPRSKEEADLVIAELRDRVMDGEAFSDLARTYSDCPSKVDGGDLGRFSHAQMTQKFSDAAFALTVGEVSAPVYTQFGVHLITRTE